MIHMTDQSVAGAWAQGCSNPGDTGQSEQKFNGHLVATLVFKIIDTMFGMI